MSGGVQSHSDEGSLSSIRIRQGSYGPIAPWPFVRRDSSFSASGYAEETWADTTVMHKKLLTIDRALEKCVLKFNLRTRVFAALTYEKCPIFATQRNICISRAKQRCAGHILKRREMD
ncbi:hypothetical protein RB195_013662 [Necator americanus]|uniref:Uncharacterized protein n=1 Tax=Necator americanus TaxID=51031 RepID=A0ABR1DWR5_NECAM